MKIKQALFTAGYSSFYFDDQQAIKNGAGHDGFFYTGEPVTQGFNAVRQAGECVSVQLILENGAVAVGDCAAVQYSGQVVAIHCSSQSTLFRSSTTISSHYW